MSQLIRSLRGFVALLLNLIVISLAVANMQTTIAGPIKTVVVLVMENRSFDHMLGYMKALNPEIDGLTGTESNPLSLTEQNSSLVHVSNNAVYVSPGDPGHSYQAIASQIFGNSDQTLTTPPPMNGFAAQAESMTPGFSQTTMSAFKPEEVPIHTTLGQQFAIFDKWFASVPSSTQPNRLYVHSATSHGLMSNDETILSAGLPQKTIFESIEDAGLSFGIYYQQVPSTLYYRNLRKLKYVDKFHLFDVQFKNDAKNGNLPTYTVIEPRYFDLVGSPGNDDHPSHDVAEGQRFIKEVYESLRAGPQWNELLFIITYDEHGGFYDHVPTPVANVPSPDGLIGSAPPYSFNFKRLGVRVPTILVSPWIDAGTVVHEPQGPTSASQYEHSSIPATVRILFNLSDPFLTARDAWAGTFENILSTRTTPRTDAPVTLPTPPSTLRFTSTDESASTTEFQEEIILLASVLKGDYNLPSSPSPQASRQKMTVREGFTYATDAVGLYFAAGRAALKAGLNPETEIQV